MPHALMGQHWGSEGRARLAASKNHRPGLFLRMPVSGITAILERMRNCCQLNYCHFLLHSTLLAFSLTPGMSYSQAAALTLSPAQIEPGSPRSEDRPVGKECIS